MLGSKITNLTTLTNNNINVPEFTTITFNELITNTEELNNIIEQNDNKSIKQQSKILKQYIKDNINKNIKLPKKNTLYAVRSSSNIEDGEHNSFAGQFDTYLNVSKEDIINKIILCTESLYNENVLSYIKEKEIPITELQMNIIIQEMVNSEYSGILFTSNPQGLLNESVIVVGKGLGNNVVEDKIDTTSYYYNTTDNIYYYEGKEDYLNKNTIEELINLSKQIKDILGEYLDIEFAISKNKIFILQARLITTLDDTNPLILDNSNIVESYPGLSLPITISFVKSVYSGVFESVSRRVLKNERELRKHKTVFKNMIGSANGRIYYKISNWYTLIKFLPLNKKIIPIWQEMLGVKNKTYNKQEVKLNPITRIMTYFNSIYEILSTQRHMKKLNKKFIKVNEKFYSRINTKQNILDVLDLYKEIEDELLSCWDVTLLNDMYTFIFTGLLKTRLKKKYKNYEEKANKYISGISNIESLKPIKELINLSYDQPKLTKKEFENRFINYINEYGDRNLEELKLESKTFRSDPMLLTKKILEYQKDLNKLKEIHKNINNPSTKLDYSKEDILTKRIIKECTKGIKNREISRLNRSRIYGMVRLMLNKIAIIYQKENIISELDDINYLTLEEIRELVRHKTSKKELIESRKKEYELYKQLPAYTRLIFSSKEFNKTHTNINSHKVFNNEKELRGIPCSNGKVTKEALVITNVNETLDVKDKILITKMTDPGWVFLLATASGVISEKGSLLSHTAIISRELKIPAIVGVENLLNTIHTGDLIEMDGNKGTIKIIKKGDQ